MKKVISVLIAMAFVVAIAAPVFASNEASGPAMDAARGSAKYTGDVATGTVKTVGEAVKGTTETAVSPFTSLWRSMTGRGKARDVVTEPLKKGGKTVHDAAVGTGQTVRGKR